MYYFSLFTLCLNDSDIHKLVKNGYPIMLEAQAQRYSLMAESTRS